MAALAGSWLVLAHGWGGLRLGGDSPAFAPRIPAGWTRYHFRLMWRGSVIEVAIDAEGATYRRLSGAPVEIVDHGRPVRLADAAVRMARPAVQGVIFDLDERLHATALAQDGHDIRDASVRELQRRFMVDAQQAQRVATIAESLYEQAQPRAGREARRELLWACALHEIGMMVSHHDHHRHSAYLLAHVDAPGFSQSQQRRVGEVVLGQRGGLRKVEASLTQETFAWQVLCLRLGVIKCHARGEVRSDAMRLTRQGTQARLDLSAEWAASNPRALYLLQEEVQAWARGGVLKLSLH